MSKMNTFKFTCTDCSHKYTDESTDESLEAECPKCGVWNCKETPKLKKINKAKMTEAKAKVIMDIL